MCLLSRGNHCTEMRYLGSASVTPHSDGLFREEIVLPARQLVRLPRHVDPVAASLVEPTAIALHAITRAGNLANKDVAIVGAGPIGLLILVFARKAGAASVAVVEPNENRQSIASKFGADVAASAVAANSPVFPSSRNIVFEASGAIPGLNTALNVADKGAVVVQVGNLGNGIAGVDLGHLLVKELDLRGTFRFSDEFQAAVDAVNDDLIPAADLVSHQFSFDQLPEALEATSEPTALKIVLRFTEKLTPTYQERK